ncbi:hypothetical protein PR048_022032 [Dryococelus australis]|uniref:Uncharacterized protein n=1 Tax=Dryococelus australis TaxID=614101 RepID=A0ABQ9GZW1_9NEOP|nr:hypothetical protein PR048_022032 [Dryococelus australis]
MYCGQPRVVNHVILLSRLSADRQAALTRATTQAFREGIPNIVTFGKTVADISLDYHKQTRLEDSNREKFRIIELAKEFDISRLPPTENAAKYQLLRVHLQCIVSKTPDTTDPDPTLWGWQKANEEFQPIMTDISPALDSLLNMIHMITIDEPCYNMSCTCRRYGLPCSSLCKSCCGKDSRNSLGKDDEMARLYLVLNTSRSRSGVAVRLLASHHGEPVRFPDFRMWKSCRTISLAGGFSRGSPVSPALAFRRCFILTSLHPSSALKTSMLRAAQISSHILNSLERQYVHRYRVQSVNTILQHRHLIVHPLVHMVFGTSWITLVQSSHSTVTADNQLVDLAELLSPSNPVGKQSAWFCFVHRSGFPSRNLDTVNHLRHSNENNKYLSFGPTPREKGHAVRGNAAPELTWAVSEGRDKSPKDSTH